MNQLTIDGQSLALSDAFYVSHNDVVVSIHPDAIKRMQRSRQCIIDMVRQERVVYGVNTGFGKLANVHIPQDELEELQLNLVLSHACGAGDPIPVPIVRSAMLQKANALCKGFSGSRPEIAQLLLDMLN